MFTSAYFSAIVELGVLSSDKLGRNVYKNYKVFTFSPFHLRKRINTQYSDSINPGVIYLDLLTK